jgi:hypothetical protein
LRKSNFRRFGLGLIATILLSAAASFVLFAVRDPAGVAGLGAMHVPPGFKVELAAGPELSSYPMMGTSTIAAACLSPSHPATRLTTVR